MKIKKLAGRGLALLLAGTFLLSNNGTLLEYAQAATGDNKNSLELSFVEGKSLVGAMIRGQQDIEIRADNTDAYALIETEGKKGLIVYKDSNNLADPGDLSVTTYRRGNNYDIFRLTAEKAKDASGKIIRTPTHQYTIKGNYVAMQTEARAEQTKGESWGSSSIMLLSGAPIAVGETSVATLTYQGGSRFVFNYSATTNPDDPDYPGVFTKWRKSVSMTSSDLPDEPSETPQTFTLEFYEGSSTHVFNFTPKSYYSIPEVDVDGNPVLNPDGSNKMKRVYGMQPGDEFQITLSGADSNDLQLTVYDQVDILSGIATNAANYQQQVHPEMVKDPQTGREEMQDPDYIWLKDNDDLYFISGDFSLRGVYESLNKQKVTLDWKFIDERTGQPNDNVVKISGSREWKAVTVTPEQTDVKGKLVVTATYTDPNFFPIAEGDTAILQEVTREVNITIHGTGVPASIERIDYTIGQSGHGSMAFPNTTFKMDKYQGGVAGYPEPEFPYSATFVIKPGSGNGFAEQFVLDSSNPEALTATIYRSGEDPSTYNFGDPFSNDDDRETPRDLFVTVYANTKDTLTNLDFRFFIDGNEELVEDPRAAKSLTVSVIDTSPDDTAKLKELTIRDKKNNRVDLEGFSFSPDTYTYQFTIPYEVENVILKPVVWDTAQKDIGVNVELYNDRGLRVEAEDNIWEGKGGFDKNWYDDSLAAGEPKPSIKSGVWGGMQINFPEPGQKVRVTYKVRAQNPGITQDYWIEITRATPSDDSTLKSLQLVDEEGTDWMVPIEAGVLKYEIHVPYRTKLLQVLPELNHPGAKIYKYDPALGKKELFGSENWLTTFPDNGMSMLFRIDIQAQNGIVDDESHYEIQIIRDEPSDISTAASLEVTDANENVLALNPPFAGELEDENGAYSISVPYITDKVRVRVHPDDPYATVRLEYWVNNSKRDQTLVTDALSKPIDIPVRSEAAPYYEILVVVTAESGKETIYKLHVDRAEPDTDAYLAGLDLKDLAGELQDFDDPFDPEVTSYTATVLYAVDKVTVTPTTSSATATVTVNGRKVESGQPSATIKLDYPKATDIEVKVTAQDGETVRIYRLRVKRADPSSDSRLRALEVSDVDRLKPVFLPRTLSYTANVNEGVKEVTVTATVNDPYATLQIEGKPAESGKPSEPIPLMDINQTITVIVTAQDGKNSTTYTVDLYNTNMVEKSSNADLEDLEVKYGLMTPEFASSVTSYDVAVKEDVHSVELIPTPADPMAKVQVFAGTLEIGDEEGNFSQAIVDGENEFTVRVTAPDGSKYKDYTVMVYRNEEDRMGYLTPITADDIDFENSGDIIVVDITKYTRVAADVFNELKNHPEKTIIFEGNDYSLQFDAADIQKIIPHTDVFDFSLSFTSPERDAIMSKIRRYSANDGIRTVLIHFGDSKELPAPARFTISLGRKYRDEQLYWHYWNGERSRIDYYGTVDTNSKGTFAVKLERLGDYIVADQRIAGSEDKSSAIAQDGDLSKDTSLMKTNPNTGERGERE